ncbi:MAG: Nuclear transport factor 2 [Gomphillus americanus]|uniref:Nuclear transport factor 2 n=1 Tax=Gomphillus americanus TaxID=1940652 RepID=A0A8H3IB98_9LECA|nr:MAG: Nuclear transport factor 2 [Gomphillus americanus]
MANFEDVAKEFVGFYYNTFDSDRSQLTALYRDTSMLTFESSATQGAAAIGEKLANLSFTNVKHVVTTLDAQPSVNNGIVVLVTGQLQTEGEERPMNYTQVFQLLPEGETYYVHNDVFKLIYG